MTRTLIIAIAAAALLGSAALSQALAAGGLSISPAIVEHAAQPGTAGSVEVANTTSGPLAVTVAVRPWRQARSGAVAPNRRRSLASQVRVSASSFSLAPGARRSVTLTLLRAPSAGSLYGAIEIIGKPPKPKKRTAIAVAYRLVGSLRLNPAGARRKLRLRLNAARVTGKGAKRTIAVALRNGGNTVDPVSGTARIAGPRGSRTVAIAAKRIVPGATVDVPLGSVRGLPKGHYRARISLLQGGKQVLSSTRAFRIR
jgi:P pilus assembly chaperone PapD